MGRPDRPWDTLELMWGNPGETPSDPGGMFTGEVGLGVHSPPPSPLPNLQWIYRQKSNLSHVKGGLPAFPRGVQVGLFLVRGIQIPRLHLKSNSTTKGKIGSRGSFILGQSWWSIFWKLFTFKPGGVHYRHRRKWPEKHAF